MLYEVIPNATVAVSVVEFGSVFEKPYLELVPVLPVQVITSVPAFKILPFDLSALQLVPEIVHFT